MRLPILLLILLIFLLAGCGPRPAPAPTRVAPTRTPLPPLPTATERPFPTLFVAPASHIYYVAPDGSDANPGTREAPWRTIQQAADSLRPGDTVQIRAGVYRERVIITQGGNAAAGFVRFTAYPGETPILDGTGIRIPPSGGLVHLVNAHYVLISGLTVTNSDDAGIYARGGLYLEILNNTTRNTHSSGIGIWKSDHVLVDGNTVIDARSVPLDQSGHEESISIASTTNFEVRSNDISLQNAPGYLGNEAIDVKESSRDGEVHHNYVHDFPDEGGAIYIDAWRAGLNGEPTLSNIDVYNNVLENAGSITVGSEQGGTAENIRIFNNLVKNGPWVGISISATLLDGPRRNIAIYHNTVYKARSNGGAGIYIISANIQNVVIRNNLINMDQYNGQIVAAVKEALPNIRADHNIVFGPKRCSVDYPNCVELSDLETETVFANLTADPLFVDAPGGDFHLAPGSPAIDAGADLSDLGLATDLDNHPRPRGAGYDIGAYEVQPGP